MSPSIRRPTANDLSAMVDLLLYGAHQRQALNPAIWPLAADAAERIEKAVAATLDVPATQGLWLIAQSGDHIAGIAHAMIVTPPPIYDIAAGNPGLILDDCVTAADAPPGTAPALLDAMEAALRAAGAAGLIASAPAAGPWRPLFEQQGYEPVTLYMAKAGLAAHDLPPDVRPAQADDIAGIVARSAEHRRTLSQLNDRFWHTHPQADARFEMWMRYSLSLTDRDMFVAGTPVHGYAIAQPAPQMHVPVGHDIKTVGLIDDYFDSDFADVAALSNRGASAAALLTACESAFVRRGFAATLVVCPAKWTSKAALLKREGYRTAKLWMLKR